MVDVFVVGGGPVGLATAIAARRKGFSVTLADAQRPPIDKACGEGLMPDALRTLGQLGISVPQDAGFPFRGIRLIDGALRVDASFPNGVALGMRRPALHGLLVEQAEKEGVEMLWGSTVSALDSGGVYVDGHRVPARWIVGADGIASRIRQWAGLEATWRNTRRYGFRRHYQAAPWTDCMEIYWGRGCQVYVTPVSRDSVCIALVSRDPGLRLKEGLAGFPQLLSRLGSSPAITFERGAITICRKLRRVYRGNVALAGDASGSVDAITGEGICIGFQHAIALADALKAGDPARYAAAHARLWRRPAFMGDFMLALGAWPRLRSRAIRALAANPAIFSSMLAMHVGELKTAEFARTGAALGLRMLTA